MTAIDRLSAALTKDAEAVEVSDGGWERVQLDVDLANLFRSHGPALVELAMAVREERRAEAATDVMLPFEKHNATVTAYEAARARVSAALAKLEEG